MLALKIVLIIICSYFIGNFNAAVFISKLKKQDIRTIGSGNPGAVNMARSFGTGWGVMTLLIDALKGVIPALAATLILDDSLGIYIAGFSVMIGHMLPVVYKFKGGKGVATVIGIYFVANWWVALIVFALAVICVLVLHYGFISSLIIVTTMTVLEIVVGDTSDLSEIARIIIILVLFVSIVFAHRKNFVRLFKGTENKLYLIKKKKPIEPIPETVSDTEQVGDNITTQTE